MTQELTPDEEKLAAFYDRCTNAHAADKMCKALDLTPDCINRTDALIPKFCGKDIEEAFEDGANYALGKQEKDADTVIQGWVARDEDNTLTLFYGSNKPSKEDGDDYWSVAFGNTLEYLNQNMFPHVKWEDAEPTRVEIIIKRKKK